MTNALTFKLLRVPCSVFLITLLTACGSITGLENAQSDFACSVAMNPTCASVSRVHAAIDRKSLTAGEESQSVTLREGEDAPSLSPEKVASAQKLPHEKPYASHYATTSLVSVAPARTPEKLLRIWVAPFIDEEGDLHGEQFIHVTVKGAAWLALEEGLGVALSTPQTQKMMLTPLKARREP